MNSTEIAVTLENHITHLKHVRAILFNLSTGDSSIYAQREAEMCGEVSKLITEIEINLAQNARLAEQWSKS